ELGGSDQPVDELVLPKALRMGCVVRARVADERRFEAAGEQRSGAADRERLDPEPTLPGRSARASARLRGRIGVRHVVSIGQAATCLGRNCGPRQVRRVALRSWALAVIQQRMGLGARGVSLPMVAREAITGWLDGQEPAPRPGLGLQAAVFVTLRAPDLTRRGCMGSLEPLTDDVVEETQRAAILAAAKDPRFPALAYPELSELVIEVSVLGAAEPIVSAGELDPGRY